MTAACPQDFPASATGRLETIEKRLDAMLTAIKTVRPAFDAFYATLTDEQKARINTGGPRRLGLARLARPVFSRNWAARALLHLTCIKAGGGASTDSRPFRPHAVRASQTTEQQHGERARSSKDHDPRRRRLGAGLRRAGASIASWSRPRPTRRNMRSMPICSRRPASRRCSPSSIAITSRPAAPAPLTIDGKPNYNMGPVKFATVAAMFWGIAGFTGRRLIIALRAGVSRRSISICPGSPSAACGRCTPRR